jgi:hypothetical protein
MAIRAHSMAEFGFGAVFEDGKDWAIFNTHIGSFSLESNIHIQHGKSEYRPEPYRY